MNRPMTLFVPRDSTSVALGADEIAHALRLTAAKHGLDIAIIRNGSRGLTWLEPLIEVATPAGRLGFGPVAAADVDGLLAGPAPFAVDHPLCLGLVEEIPYLAKQRRLTFARVGVTDPLSLGDYRDHGGFDGLVAALARPPDDIVAEIVKSGLRGRGGAAFPTGVKWKTVRDAPGDGKNIVCNADEGDSGTFSDRMILEGDPFMLIEGMIIAGIAVGAGDGFVYVRGEYPDAIDTLNAAIDIAEGAGYLGTNILGSGFDFRIEVRKGAGSYICGEETAMLESLEGRRGVVRAKPPLPAIAGLFGRPSVINNLITLAAVPRILAAGAADYERHGISRSRGTLPFQLAGNIKRGGLVEAAFGLTLNEPLYDFGGGTLSGRPIRAVQVGGPLGAYIPPGQFDVKLDYEALAAIGATLGHGGVVVFDDSVDMANQARYAMEFCAIESCGKCTPCRLGSIRGVEVIDKIRRGSDVPGQLELLRDLCEVMVSGSLCAMGGMTPNAVLSAINHFPDDFRARM